jgi:pimeloyl-ACP methyl ester carboxylesterase
MNPAQVVAAQPLHSVSPASEWVTLTNLRSYHYVVAGPEGAPALLFLHGYADSWRGAEAMLPHLQAHFRVFALDQRGHGASDSDFDRFSIEDFSRDAIDFIENVVGGPVTLVGHSLGSLVAQRVAHHARDLVKCLILIGSSDTSGGNPVLIDLKHAVAARDSEAALDFAPLFQNNGFAKALETRPIVAQKVATTLADDDQVVAGRIRVPTLVLWGDQDAVFDLYAQRRLQGLLPQSKLTVYPEIGHAPNREIPETVARDIILFSARE